MHYSYRLPAPSFSLRLMPEESTPRELLAMAMGMGCEPLSPAGPSPPIPLPALPVRSPTAFPGRKAAMATAEPTSMFPRPPRSCTGMMLPLTLLPPAKSGISGVLASPKSLTPVLPPLPPPPFTGAIRLYAWLPEGPWVPPAPALPPAPVPIAMPGEGATPSNFGGARITSKPESGGCTIGLALSADLAAGEPILTVSPCSA